MKKLLVGAVLGALAIGGFAVAQSISVPQVTIINGNDLFQDVVRGAPAAGNQYASGSLLAAYVMGQPGGSADFNNSLIGGDATTNLFQRATTGASQTTTVAYGGPDRWAYWSGASTAMTVSRTSATTDVPSQNFQYAFKMARTSGQTGVVQMCMAQEIESVNAYALQGQTVELDFHAIAGANYSGGNLQVYIITGTAADEGMQKLAFGLNAGGGGSAGWTGQANAIAGTIAIGTSTTASLDRYTAAATIPTAALEVGVAICYTPTGTAGTNDYVAVTGIQLARNQGMAPYVGTTSLSSTVPALSFARRPIGVETALQQRYTYSINEGTITAGTAMAPAGIAVTTGTCLADIPFPVTMRAAPSYTNALTATTFKVNAAALNTALSTPFSATTGVNTINGGSITFTGTGLAGTAGFGCILVSAAGSGQLLWSAEL